MDVACVHSATFQRSSGCVLQIKAQNQFVSSSLIFCESLLRQAATPFCIVPVTFDLTVVSTFSVLM